ncbi:deoxynucleotide monophosphate kinase family protein [Chitinilyticum aquatile]|uniref:deoxynucleotide monophosphate kinase family protein n=1 Tax=Chitinilyticum aquatile TaxID=362520 RepID=UPI000419FDEE|nr:hypothetical protein [Chitinilyticum aquatile]
MTRPIIGLTGLAGSGKDTVADHLCAVHGFARLAYADKLREEVAHAWGIDLQPLLTRENKEIPTPVLALANCQCSRFKLAMYQLLISDADDPNDPATDEKWHLELTQPRSPRWIMQRWGTDFRRAWFGDSYWRDALAHQLADISGPVVITDVRFDDEAIQLSQLGGEIWHITRPNLAPVEGHASERGIATCYIDRWLDNASSTAHLHGLASIFLDTMIYAQEGKAA